MHFRAYCENNLDWKTTNINDRKYECKAIYNFQPPTVSFVTQFLDGWQLPHAHNFSTMPIPLPSVLPELHVDAGQKIAEQMD